MPDDLSGYYHNFWPNGKIGDSIADKPILLMGGDHPYAQWGGNGMLAAYLDNGIQPYLSVNSAGVGVTPGNTDTLTWAQIAEIRGQVELVNHGARHIQSWSRINTGIRVVYSGAAGSATMQVTSTGVTLVGNGGAENATLTFATYPALAELVAAISAQGGGVWTATAAAELTGTEASGNLLVVAARNVKASTNNQYFAAGGGIIIRYAGLAHESVYAVRTSTTLEIYCDGVRRVNVVLANAATDTLSEVVSTINAAGITGLTAWLCDNQRAETASFLSYLQGDEDSQNLKVSQGDIQLTEWSCEAGLPRWYMIDRQIESSHAAALAQGIAFTHFAQAGSDFPQHLTAGHRYASYRGTNTSGTRGISPYQVPAALGDPRFTIYQTTQDNSSNPWTDDQAIAVLDAMADSGPFVVNLMNHKVLPDSSSGYDFPNPDSYYNMAEADWIATLQAAKAHIQSGAIQSLKPSDVPQARRSRNKPENFIFNPKFRNDGSALLNANDAGFKIPGWALVTSNSIYSAVSVADGVMTLTTTSATITSFLSQELILEAGKTYEFGLLVDIPTFTSGNAAVRVMIEPRRGRIPGVINDSTGKIFTGFRIAGTATNGRRTQHVRFRFAVPKTRDYRFPKVVSVGTGPFNLGSSPADVKINIDSKAQLNVNCAGATPSATTVDEVVSALNTAIAGSASYPVEYRTPAKNVGNKVVISGPYMGIEERNDAGYGISLDAGTTNSATATIFGSGQCRGIGMVEPYADGSQILWLLTLRSEMVGTFSISKPYVREIQAQ